VGGHTSEGAELAPGFAGNGLVPATAAPRQGGLEPGDGPLLTKPPGTGTPRAPALPGEAKGRRGMGGVAPTDAADARGGPNPAAARRPCRDRRDRVRSHRASDRDGARLRR